MVTPGYGLKVLMVAAMLASGTVRAGDDDAWESLVAAERAFARQAADEGVRAAFLRHLTEDSVVFAPQPQPGRAVWEARPANADRLEWAPAVAEVALAGDLGYTYGPWRFTPEGAEAPQAHGHYLTVWQKDVEGTWKVRIDLGIDHAPASFPERTRRVGAASLDSANLPAYPPGLPELRQADLLPPGAVDAKRLADDAVLLRTGFLPVNSRQGVAMPSAGVADVASGALLARSGDLAVTWGGSRAGPSWLRVWRRPGSSDPPGLGWRLAVDLAKPAPVAP